MMHQKKKNLPKANAKLSSNSQKHIMRITNNRPLGIAQRKLHDLIINNSKKKFSQKPNKILKNNTLQRYPLARAGHLSREDAQIGGHYFTDTKFIEEVIKRQINLSGEILTRMDNNGELLILPFHQYHCEIHIHNNDDEAENRPSVGSLQPYPRTNGPDGRAQRHAFGHGIATQLVDTYLPEIQQVQQNNIADATNQV